MGSLTTKKSLQSDYSNILDHEDCDMGDFRRRLPEKSWDALERLASSGTGWWPDLLAQWTPSGSPDGLRLAVRNGYMNFYSKGQSIAKTSFGRGGTSPTMRIHEKYVKKRPNGGQRYIKFINEIGYDPDGRSVEYGGPSELQDWIGNSLKYSGSEKRCIDALIAVTPKVIDLEMGLPAFGERKSAARMDIVALEGTPEDIRLIFWEAKMIGDSRLRSRKGEPRVFEQVEPYRTFLNLENRRQQVAAAYRECCNIICDLHEIAGRVGNIGPIDPLVKAAAKSHSNLTVDPVPRLVIFDEGKKRDEAVWEKHLQVLCRRLSVTILKERPIRDPLESFPRHGK